MDTLEETLAPTMTDNDSSPQLVFASSFPVCTLVTCSLLPVLSLRNYHVMVVAVVQLASKILSLSHSFHRTLCGRSSVTNSLS